MTGAVPAPRPVTRPRTTRPVPRPIRPPTPAAGVDIDAGERAVELIKPLVASTLRPEVLGGLGGFGRPVRPGPRPRYRQPVLVAGTDGVGTKALVAQALGRFDTIGIDLVAMCVDDLVCQGAEPLFLLDYISTGAVDPSRMAELVAGVAEGCRQVGCQHSSGGEMAEHPGVDEARGVRPGRVRRRRGRARRGSLGSARVRAGDVLIGLASPGLRCNGYTLARHVLLERAGPPWTARPGRGPGLSSLADELLRPSVIYTPAVRAPCRHWWPRCRWVHAVAHITGGGFEGNLPRALPGEARRPFSTGGRGRSRRSSERSGGWATSPMTRWPGCSTSGSGMVMSGRCRTVSTTPSGPARRRRGRHGGGPGGRGPSRGASSPVPGSGPGSGPTGRRRPHERLAPASRVRGAAGPPAGALGQTRRLRPQVGTPSNWFIDSKQTVCRPEGMVLVAEGVLSRDARPRSTPSAD